MEGRKGMFKASHGKELYFETWSQHDSAAAGTGGSVAVFLTGVHESADTTTVRELAGLFAGELGHEFICLEHHGHGRSYGRRGQVESFDLLCSDAVEFVAWRLAQGAGKVLLLGHSMGGAVAAWVSEELARRFGERFLGAVLVAPALAGPSVGGATRAALAVGAWLLPGLKAGPPDDPEAGMPPAEAAAYRASPHNFLENMRLGTAAMFIALFDRTAAALAQGALAPSAPLLIVHGDRDATVPLAASQAPPVPPAPPHAPAPLSALARRHASGTGTGRRAPDGAGGAGAQRLVAACAARGGQASLAALPGEGHQPLCSAGRAAGLAAIRVWAAPRLRA